MIDIGPAADRMTNLVAIVAEDQFDQPTPCPGMNLGELVDHVRGLTTGFSAVARKDLDATQAPPQVDVAHLEAGWRDQLTRDLATLAAAWREPDAWEGMTSAAGVPLPGPVAGLVALDEL